MSSARGLARMIQSLHTAVWRRRVLINIVLSVTALALAVALLVRHWLSAVVIIAAEDRVWEQAAYVASMLADVATISALLLGGLWSYYIFVKGRTFKPRLHIGLALKSMLRGEQNVALVTCRIVNAGKVRIRPKYAAVDVARVDADGGALHFKPHQHIADLFSLVYAEAEAFWLEPQDQLTMDFVVMAIPESSRAVEKLIHVKIQIVDCDYNLWRQSAILVLTEGGD